MYNKIILKVKLNLYKLLNNSLKQNFKKVFIKGKKLEFLVINSLTKSRYQTFFSKEPETLNFINNFRRNSIFWDIGANIGLYSCYAAKISNSKVYAFEPSYFNLEVLVRNIYKNKLENKITVMPICLNSRIEESFFNLSDVSYGSALSTFGSKTKSIFKYKSISMSIDFMIKKNLICVPDYVKLDVDGNELEILEGFKCYIKKIKSIILEIDYKNKIKSKKIYDFFKKNGFVRSSKNQSKIFKNTIYDKTFNEVWLNKRIK